MSAKYCRNCGEPLKAGAKFCRKCGTKIPEAGPVKEPPKEKPDFPSREKPDFPSREKPDALSREKPNAPPREETVRERPPKKSQKLIIHMDKDAERTENPQDYAKYFNKPGDIG